MKIQIKIISLLQLKEEKLHIHLYATVYAILYFIIKYKMNFVKLFVQDLARNTWRSSLCRKLAAGFCRDFCSGGGGGWAGKLNIYPLHPPPPQQSWWICFLFSQSSKSDKDRNGRSKKRITWENYFAVHIVGPYCFLLPPLIRV